MKRVSTGVTSDLETRQRLLNVAERLFADRGFKNVTVRDICASANANVAAINYHFGDKMGLYREVLQSAIDKMRATTEAARQAGEGQSAEEQLRRFIKIFVHRVLAAGSETVHRLITREVHDPTPAIDTIIEQGVRPRIEYLSVVLSELIGCEPTDTRVLRCLASIQAQSIAYRYNPIADRLGLSLDPKTPEQVDAVAEHIADFSIGGVRAIAQEK
jgi:TetR/AcrR family transcriptional regulator, regulator of cefoperazone and chloramphenicol sensitivity